MKHPRQHSHSRCPGAAVEEHTRSREGRENINMSLTLTLDRGRARFRLLGVSVWSSIAMAPALRFPSKLEMLSCSARAAGSV